MGESLGERIKKIRVELGLNKTQFGQKFGATGSLVNKWENNSVTPSNERIKAIADLANISVDTLLNGKDDYYYWARRHFELTILFFTSLLASGHYKNDLKTDIAKKTLQKALDSEQQNNLVSFVRSLSDSQLLEFTKEDEFNDIFLDKSDLDEIVDILRSN